MDLTQGMAFRMLTIRDETTPENLAIDVSRGLTSVDVLERHPPGRAEIPLQRQRSEVHSEPSS